MKSFKLIMAIMVFGLLAMTIYACGESKKSNNTNTEQTEELAKQGKEYTSDYICPMHCKGSGSDKPGECPACGMAYVEKKDDGHDHDHDHHGHDHDHGDHSGHNH